MEKISNDYLDNTVQTIQSGKQARKPISSDMLTKEQREVVGYFFTRLRMLNAKQYDHIMHDEKTEKMVRREYASYLIEFSRDQIDIGFDGVHQLRQGGNRDYQWLDIDRIIGVIRCGGKDPRQAVGAEAHKILPKRLGLESDEKKARRLLAGKKAMAQLMKELA